MNFKFISLDNSIVAIGIMFIIIGFYILSTDKSSQEADSIGMINVIQGEIKLRHSGQITFRSIKKSSQVEWGASIFTSKDSKAKLALENGDTFTLDSDTLLVLKKDVKSNTVLLVPTRGTVTNEETNTVIDKPTILAKPIISKKKVVIRSEKIELPKSLKPLVSAPKMFQAESAKTIPLPEPVEKKVTPVAPPILKDCFWYQNNVKVVSKSTLGWPGCNAQIQIPRSNSPIKFSLGEGQNLKENMIKWRKVNGEWNKSALAFLNPGEYEWSVESTNEDKYPPVYKFNVVLNESLGYLEILKKTINETFLSKDLSFKPAVEPLAHQKLIWVKDQDGALSFSSEKSFNTSFPTGSKNRLLLFVMDTKKNSIYSSSEYSEDLGRFEDQSPQLLTPNVRLNQ